METQAALSAVARLLNVPPRALGFAGTKDKRGVTAQYASAFKVAPAQLSALNSRCVCIKCTHSCQLVWLPFCRWLCEFGVLVTALVVADPQHALPSVQW